MWLKRDLEKICLKEFTVRHQLDILQDNAYLRYNLHQLKILQTETSRSPTLAWECSKTARCNTFWFNILGFLRLFPRVTSILCDSQFINFDSIVLRKDNFSRILRERVKQITYFLEICRTVAYRGHLKEPFASLSEVTFLFSTFNSLSNRTDPEGNKLTHIGNRVNFIREWTEKLITAHTLRPTYSHAIEELKRQQNTPEKPIQDRLAVVSDKKEVAKPLATKYRVTKQHKRHIKFAKASSLIRRHPIRFSEIDTGFESSSASSEDSIWLAPFGKTQRKSRVLRDIVKKSINSQDIPSDISDC